MLSIYSFCLRIVEQKCPRNNIVSPSSSVIIVENVDIRIPMLFIQAKVTNAYFSALCDMVHFAFLT